MSLIDIKNPDKLSPEQKEQFNNLLTQFPHLQSKMTTSRELNTPTKIEQSVPPIVPSAPIVSNTADELDYANFIVPDSDLSKKTYAKNDIPSIKVNRQESFLKSFDKNNEADVKEKKEREEEVRKQVKQDAVKLGLDPEIASFSTEGKTHPILNKLRATVGMRSINPPTVVDIGGCQYSLKALDRAAVVNATALAMLTTTNKVLYETSLEAAIIAFAVVAIDSVPLYEIFSIPENVPDPEDQKNTLHMPKQEREERAAKAFYLELLRSPNELIEALGIHYQQEFPPLSLLGKDKAKFMCPVADCMQARIADVSLDCFCPIHGEKMLREDKLPNPLLAIR